MLLNPGCSTSKTAYSAVSLVDTLEIQANSYPDSNFLSKIHSTTDKKGRQKKTETADIKINEAEAPEL